MMRFLTIIFFVSFIFNVNAQEFATTKITPVLRKNANVIIRNDETTIDVKSETKVAVNYKTVFTILNKQGNDYNTLAAYYDKESALSDIKAVLYDSLGFKIKEYSKSDFADQSQISDFSIYDDNRVKYLKVDNNKYPYTVEFSYSQNYNSNFYIPSWYPQNDFHIAVEKSNFRITYPKSSPIRYKESKITKGKKLEEGDKESLIFSCNNVSAIDFEELTTGIDNISPWARISSSTFTFDNTEEGMNRFAGKDKTRVYSRWGNPTFTAAEKTIEALEAFGLKNKNGEQLELRALLHATPPKPNSLSA